MQPVYVLFGTESGNAQALAKRAGEALEEAGLSPKVVDMMDFAAKSLPDLRRLLVITSTYGNGDPPSNAEELHGYLMRKCPPLDDLVFSVCALGDTTYERFAQCGKDFDKRLGELGGKRLVDRQDCDIDYDDPFDAWLAKVVPVLQALGSDEATEAPSQPIVSTTRVEAPFTKRNPSLAKVLVNDSLHGEGATKDTRHIALSLGAAGLRYELGDSIGIWPSNDPALVSELLRVSGADGSAEVDIEGASMRLDEALRKKLEIVLPDVRLVERAFGSLSPEERQKVIADHHVIDVVTEKKLHLTPKDFVSLLRPLAPRQYSIASSLLAHPDEVHLTVAIVRYAMRGRARAGVVSQELADRSPPGTELPIFLHQNPSFRLAAAERPIIMIGPGTGIAPFRSFLEERRATAAKGKAWLFFGSRNRTSDFLYEKDLQGFLGDGTLTKLDVAFSRDQEQKIYVQTRMREQRAELYRWIEEGAVVYVCGDAHHMAVDVHTCLRDVLVSEARLSPEAASARLDEMSRTGSYQKDVY